MTKVYKNPNRSVLPPTFKPYTPEYKKRNIEPSISPNSDRPFKSNGAAVIVGEKSANTEQLKLQPTLKQNANTNVPYAEAIDLPETHSIIPNVGNNIETVWNSVDSMVIDDLSDIDNQAKMVDNNDYYTDYAIDNIKSSVSDSNIITTTSNIDLNEDEYLIAINGSIISTGALDPTQTDVRALVLGEHPLYSGQQIPIEDIIILKRIKIKMGVFLDE